MRPFLRPLCLSLLLFTVMPLFADHGRVQRRDPALAGWPLSDFHLLDQRGAPLSLEHLHGWWTFLLVGDSRCARPCTEALSALAGLYARIARTDALATTRVLFVSLDERDTPADLRRFLGRYPSRFIGASGHGRSLADDLGVPYPEPGRGDPPTGDTVGYDGSIWLVDPEGIIQARMIPPFDVPLLTAEYMRARVRRR